MLSRIKTQPSYLFRYALCAAMVAAALASPWHARAGQQRARRPAAPAPSIVGRCRADLARTLHIAPGAIRVVAAQRVSWPDAALGMPRPGLMYAQMVTPGWRVVLSTANTAYLYVTSERSFTYGGPVPAWSLSALYLEPIPDEPNLNGDLMQVSLMGTNPTTIMRAVSEFYPMPNGGIIAKRRDSRSGHTLLFRAPGGGEEGRVLHRAFDFGAACATADGRYYAAFVRGTLSLEWRIAYGSLAGDRDQAGTLELPANARPGAMGIEHGMLLAEVKVGGQSRFLQVVREAGGWRVRALGPPEPGLGTPVMLNKSETLEVAAAGDAGHPATRLVRKWFTGHERAVATVPGLAHAHLSVSPDLRFAFLTGVRDGRPAACTVDLATGEVIPLSIQTREAVKLYSLRPATGPLRAAGRR